MKIGLLGTHCTGKTTFAKDICEEIPGYMVSESARDCPYPLNQSGDIRSQMWILTEQMRRETAAVCENATVVCDRTTIDNMAYAQWLFDHGRLNPRYYQPYIDAAASWISTYDVLIYVPFDPSIPLELDGVRLDDRKYQQEIDEIISSFIDMLDIPVHEATGSRQKRVSRAMEAIDDARYCDGDPEQTAGLDRRTASA